MTVPTHVRRGSRPADNYTLISNGLIRDRRLSDRARMLAIWLLSHREDFRVDTDAMSTAMGVGRDRTRASLRELEDAGYLTREHVRDRGRLVAMEYSISDTPQVEANDGKPGDGGHGPENTSPYKKTKFDKDQQTEHQEKTPSPDGDDAPDELALIPASKPTPAQKRAMTDASLSDEFENQFWPAYPRQVGKHAALAVYRRVRRKGATVDDVMTGVRRYAAEKANTEARFIAHPGTWLNAGRWLDTPEEDPSRRPADAATSKPWLYRDEDYWSTT